MKKNITVLLFGIVVVVLGCFLFVRKTNYNLGEISLIIGLAIEFYYKVIIRQKII